MASTLTMNKTYLPDNPDMTVVRIRNMGAQPFKSQYANVKYEIPVGADHIIPWNAMCLWFGHPAAVDHPTDMRQRFRTDEFARLCVRYGVYERHHLIEEQFPKIEVYELLTNSRIVTVVDDPEGKEITPEFQSMVDNDNLKAQIQTLQDQISYLMAQSQQQAKDRDNSVSENVAESTIDVSNSAPDGRTDTHESGPEINRAEIQDREIIPSDIAPPPGIVMAPGAKISNQDVVLSKVPPPPAAKTPADILQALQDEDDDDTPGILIDRPSGPKPVANRR